MRSIWRALALVCLCALAGTASRAQTVAPIVSGVVMIDTGADLAFKAKVTQNITSISFVPDQNCTGACRGQEIAVGAPFPGEMISIIFTQDALGHSVSLGGITNACTVSATANQYTICLFQFDLQGGQWVGVGASGGGVASVFGRTGAITSQANDYSFAQISGSISLAQTPLTTAGDLLFANSTPTLTRLPIGTNGQCLEVVSLLPAWASCGSVSSSGTPASPQLAQWVSSSAIQGISTVGGGANPVMATITSLAQSQVLCANSTPAIINCTQGVPGRTVTIATDTVAATDRTQTITYNSGSAVATTFTSPATLGSNFATGQLNIGAGVVTNTLGAGTFQTTNTTTKALNQGEWCTFNSPDNVGITDRCSSGLITAGTNITLTRSATGVQIAASGGSGQASIPYGTGGGTAQAQTVASSTPTVTALTTGIYVSWLPAANNTGSGPTLAYDGLTATTIVGPDGNALVSGDISTLNVAIAEYNGTNFVLLNPRNQVTSTGSFKCIGNPCFFASSNSNVTLQAGAFGSVTLNDGTDNYFFANRSSNNITSSTGDSTSGTSIEFDLQTTAPATNPNQVITTGAKATAALTAGQVIKIDSANAASVVVATTTDTGAGAVLGFVVNSPGVGGTAKLAIPGSIITTPVLGTGTCSIGNFVINDTTTNGRVKCTATYTAGTILGYAWAAQSTVGSTVTTYVLPR